jgi:NAD(P)-dependent dehydrogenase (short-subunit alcohol dehydrogenase family)
MVLGGRSEIGLAVALRLVKSAPRKVLLGMRPKSNSELAGADENIQVRLMEAGATEVVRFDFDADAVDTHGPLLTDLFQQHGRIDLVVLAFGILGDQSRAEREAAHALSVLHTDYVAQVSALTHLAILVREQGCGDLMVFSSVAGVRVRRANYVYGSAKAGLDGFASGLSDALAGSGARLLLVRPGFVVGRMTEGMKPAPFSSSPEQVADAAVKALESKRTVVWVPKILRPVFFLMRILPQPIWRRMPR